MSTAEITAYLYGAKLTRQALDLKAEGRGDEMPMACWLGEQEFAAIDRLGLRKFNEWMVRGGQSQLDD